MPSARLVIFTRFPEPGKAKTRLIPALGAERAAELHRCLTEHTLRAARTSGLAFEVRITGAPPSAFATWLGSDVRLVDQGEGDLGQRMRRATGTGPVLFIGSDLPDLQAEHLIEAARLLQTEEVVLGPAEDGGYWALGLTAGCDPLFEKMPWGSDRVFEITLARLRGAGIEPALLPTLADCDRPEDLARWPMLTA
jgi:rSAM/selenodomain-associated transferase 1